MDFSMTSKQNLMGFHDESIARDARWLHRLCFSRALVKKNAPWHGKPLRSNLNTAASSRKAIINHSLTSNGRSHQVVRPTDLHTSKPPLSLRRLDCRVHGSHSHHHSHDHDHSCCSSSLDYTSDEDGAEATSDDVTDLTRFLKKAFRWTGLQQLGWYLEQSTFSSFMKIACFVAAALLHWYASHNTKILGDVAVENAKVMLAKKVSMACTAMVYIFAGLPALLSLVLDVASLKIDTHVLMNLAVIGTLVAGLPLEGALLLVLFQTSHAVEHMLTDKARGSLKALFESVPDHADLILLNSNGDPDMSSLRHVRAHDVAVGEVMLVKPGCQVPLDGTIVHGQALVSAEHITGESVPTLKRQGDVLPAGSLCHDGALCVQTTRTSEDSTPARIAQLARDAQAKRPKLRTFLDVFGGLYSKIVIAGSLLSFVVMVALGVPIVGMGTSKGALYRAMGFLTVASPCALVLVPMAYVSAIATLASRGILLKGGRVLDAVRFCRIIAMDKTGTLTTGSLKVQHVLPIPCEAEDQDAITLRDVRSVAKSLSIRSSHPVSNAVISDAALHGLADVDLAVSEFNLVPGGGVTGNVVLESGKSYKAMFGSLEFTSGEMNMDLVEKIKELMSQMGIKNAIFSVLVLKDEASDTVQSVTAFVCEDSIRDASLDAVQSLRHGTWDGAPKKSECKIVMVTGDNEASASKIADALGISEVYSGLTPEEKLKIVKTLSKEANNGDSKKSSVMMIGDGLNDAAALAAARVGVAIASPTTAAASLASDVVIMNDSSGVSSIPVLLRVSQLTHRIIVQNVLLAAGSILVLALPTVLGFIPLWLAVMFHEGSTLLVALNSLRILRLSLS